MNKYRVALVGTTGVVGRITRKVLEEKNLPVAEYELFSSSKSAGSKIAFDGREYTVKELNEHSFDNNKFDYAKDAISIGVFDFCQSPYQKLR